MSVDHDKGVVVPYGVTMGVCLHEVFIEKSFRRASGGDASGRGGTDGAGLPASLVH